MDKRFFTLLALLSLLPACSRWSGTQRNAVPSVVQAPFEEMGCVDSAYGEPMEGQMYDEQGSYMDDSMDSMTEESIEEPMEDIGDMDQDSDDQNEFDQEDSQVEDSQAEDSQKDFEEQDLDQDQEFVNSEDLDQESQEAQEFGDEDTQNFESDSEKSDQKFENTYFNFNSKRVRADQKAKLAENAEKIAELSNEGYKIVVEGHACTSGKSGADNTFNEEVSLKRAQAVANYLVKNGANSENIEVIALGCKAPVVEKGNKKEQAPNRRVEIYAKSK